MLRAAAGAERGPHLAGSRVLGKPGLVSRSDTISEVLPRPPTPYPCRLRGGLGHWRPHCSELTPLMPVSLRHHTKSNHSLQKKEAFGRKCLVHTHGGWMLLVVTRHPGPQEWLLTPAFLANHRRTQGDCTGWWLRTYVLEPSFGFESSWAVQTWASYTVCLCLPFLT